ncbi:hypothetical protein D3C81_1946190 [compost metagenome]
MLADLNRVRSRFGVTQNLLQGAGGCQQFSTFHLSSLPLYYKLRFLFFLFAGGIVFLMLFEGFGKQMAPASVLLGYIKQVFGFLRKQCRLDG